MSTAEQAAIESLIAQFVQDGEQAPMAAVRSVAAYGLRAVPPLAHAAETSGLAHVRGWSLMALAEILGREAYPYLVRGLWDPQMSVRLRAVQGFLAIRHPQAGRHIAALLEDPSGGVRVTALDALVKLRFTALAGRLPALAADAKWYVRQHAARAIGELGLRDALPILEQLAEDGHGAVRNAARQALEKLDGA